MRKLFAVLVVLLIGAVCLLGVAPSLAAKYNEAPMLAELVKAGKLPPVEERLPKEPGFVRDVPKDEIDLKVGQYGGTLRMVHSAPGSDPYVFCMNNEPLLRGPGLFAEDVGGNVLRDYKVSEGGKVFTFYMREGMKWSDGVPVTTDDVLFAYEDVLLNEQLTPVFPQWMRSGNRVDGEPMKLEILDKYTFRVSFAEPYGGFPAQLAIVAWRGYTDLLKPKHYLKQFHVRYTPLEKLEPLIKELSLERGEWWTLFHTKDHTNWEIIRATGVGFPRLSPWIPTSVTPTAVILERNPYYWKVDKAGNQLPYIDRIRTELVQDVNMIVMKIISGEVDFVSGGSQGASVKDIPLLKENAEKGGYRVVLQDMHVAPVDVFLNLTHSDPIWRQVVRDVRFRKALSLGINRREIIDAVYFGFAEPSESVPSTYDPKEANRLLDEMGLDKRDAEGFRLGPDGKTFVIPFEIAMYAADHVPVTEMVVEYWKALGIKTTMKTIDTGLLGTRRDANDLKAHVLWNHQPPLWWGAIWDVIPVHWGPLWNRWLNTGGKEGEEPPEEVKRLTELIQRSLVVSPEERKRVIEGHRRLMYDNIFIIYIVEKAKYPTIAKKNLENIPHSGFAINSSFSGEQFFYRQ
ncbi:MAG: ABC transporter substrate-binding protein [bacterium]